MQNITYDEIISFLENQRESHSIEYLKKMLDIITLVIDPKKVILIAGTNGKGTTAITLQTLLVEAGKNVGFYSSPHLEETTERIKFNCIDISKDDFCEVFFAIHDKLKPYNLSHFEYLTIMAAYYFFEYHKLKIDYAIFEVGLGGTLDATNIIPHNTSVITTIGFDHENILGKHLIEIAKNKFGIIWENNIVFHTKFPREIEALSIEYSRKRSASFIQSYDYSLNVSYENNEPIFHVSMKNGDFRLNLPGKRAAENSALAVTIFDHLVENASDFLYATKKVYWPGRMEKIIYENREIYISGDHNPQGVQSLIDLLKYYHFTKIHFIVGICNDKNHSEMIRLFLTVQNSFLYLTETPIKNMPIDQYDDQFKEKSTFISPSPSEAIKVAIDHAKKNDLIIVSGSLYLVGYIKKGK